KTAGLSKIPLQWMFEEAKAAGLIVDPRKMTEILGFAENGKYVQPDPQAPMHESLKGAWNIAEFIPKRHWDWKKRKWSHRMNLYRRPTIPPGSLITIRHTKWARTI